LNLTNIKRRYKMNTMNMPGFTAEASLYTTTRHYQPIRNPSAGAGKRGVIPQQETKRVGPPVGAPGGQVQIEPTCAMLNGLPAPDLVINGPTGGKCTIKRKLTNCRAATGGGCTCETEVTERVGDCGD
jgi:hypothetical protein